MPLEQLPTLSFKPIFQRTELFKAAFDTRTQQIWQLHLLPIRTDSSLL
jgi:hypothetical protein